jgi:hypothetical protein
MFGQDAEDSELTESVPLFGAVVGKPIIAIKTGPELLKGLHFQAEYGVTVNTPVMVEGSTDLGEVLQL